jgi:predicted ATPase with chaperone activity
VTKYQKRISGPMLDRKIPHGFSGIEVPRVDYEKLSSDRVGESSASIRERVQAARERQRVRYEASDIVCPVQEPGLSSRAGTGTITTPICALRKFANSANWTKRGIL